MSRVIPTLMVLAVVGMPVFAQGPAASKPAKADTKTTEQKRDEAAREQARAQNDAQAVNVRIELTITDSRGDGPPTTKTVSIMTSDRSWGRIRTAGDVRAAGGQRYPVILNVDARPTLVRDNRARVELTIEYRPADEVTVTSTGQAIATPRRADPENMAPNINESLSAILEDGKPLVLSQSADPVTDRKVRVEAKMTIVR